MFQNHSVTLLFVVCLCGVGLPLAAAERRRRLYVDELYLAGMFLAVADVKIVWGLLKLVEAELTANGAFARKDGKCSVTIAVVSGMSRDS